MAGSNELPLKLQTGFPSQLNIRYDAIDGCELSKIKEFFSRSKRKYFIAERFQES